MIAWLDLLTEGDTHPRRFGSAGSLRDYVLKMERLSEDAADALLRDGQVGPPLTRREYRVRPLPPAASHAHDRDT